MLHVNFSAYGSYITDSLYQWDINQQLNITGLELTTAPEVHFANANMERAIVRQSTIKNGTITVTIPNSLLQAPLPIMAYIGIYEGETFKVIESVKIPVIPKQRPTDYQIETTDEEIYSFNALENLVNNALSEVRELSEDLGDMDKLITEKVEDAIEVGFDNIIDNTLSVEGKVADAKAVGDAIYKPWNVDENVGLISSVMTELKLDCGADNYDLQTKTFSLPMKNSGNIYLCYTEIYIATESIRPDNSLISVYINDSLINSHELSNKNVEENNHKILLSVKKGDTVSIVLQGKNQSGKDNLYVAIKDIYLKANIETIYTYTALDDELENSTAKALEILLGV